MTSMTFAALGLAAIGWGVAIGLFIGSRNDHLREYDDF